MLKWALQTLAQPVNVQIDLFDGFRAVHIDELALDLDAVLPVILDSTDLGVSEEQKALLRELDDMLNSISGQDNAHYWTIDAILSDDKWEAIRKEAIECLGAFDWPTERPPRYDKRALQ